MASKPPVAVIPKAAQHVQDLLEEMRKSLDAHESAELSPQPALEALQGAQQELEALERRLLERLGVPSEFMRTARLRLEKELQSWKLWLPNLVLTAAAIASFLVLFPQAHEPLDIGLLILLIVGIMLVVVAPLHEALHALGFWLLGRDRPGFKLELGKFGMGFYAAGNCLLSRREYLLMALMPLGGITLLGGLLWLLLPSLGPWFYLAMALNAAGAVGDLWIVWLIIRAHPQALCLDSSYEMAVFEPAAPPG
jgi:hypothetical protein